MPPPPPPHQQEPAKKAKTLPLHQEGRIPDSLDLPSAPSNWAAGDMPPIGRLSFSHESFGAIVIFSRVTMSEEGCSANPRARSFIRGHPLEPVICCKRYM